MEQGCASWSQDAHLTVTPEGFLPGEYELQVPNLMSFPARFLVTSLAHTPDAVPTLMLSPTRTSPCLHLKAGCPPVTLQLEIVLHTTHLASCHLSSPFTRILELSSFPLVQWAALTFRLQSEASHDLLPAGHLPTLQEILFFLVCWLVYTLFSPSKTRGPTFVHCPIFPVARTRDCTVGA